MSKVSPRHLLLALVLVASVLFLLNALRRTQQPTRPAASSTGQDAAVEGQPQDRADTATELAFAAPADADFDRYAALARTNVFSERRTQPAPPKQTTPVPPPPPLPNGGDEKPTPPKIDVSEWNYVGYVTLDGKQLGIVQNETTRTCEYLAVGDEFMGAVVETVDRESMKLKAGSARTTMSRPRDFSMLPLEKSAVTQPQRPQPRPRPPTG
ncbi:MAG: hypothetical protein JXA57_20180 [Armatimonadetes bacterium]|nr:hypothetical protein [Armatimonadota bacterium]